MCRFHLCAAVLAVAAVAHAQQQPGLPLPRLETVNPPGAKAGVGVAELILTGTDLDETDTLLFSHPGITAAVVPLPPDPKPDPKDPKKAPPPPPKKGVPAANKFKITVAPDVPPGQYDVRAVNKF